MKAEGQILSSLKPVHQRHFSNQLLSGDDLAMTRLHWGTQEATFIIALMIGEIEALQQALSIKPVSFCNNYAEENRAIRFPPSTEC